MELITAIALLCTPSSGGETGSVVHTAKRVDRYQLECQKYYIDCHNKHKLTTAPDTSLMKCIQNREP